MWAHLQLLRQMLRYMPLQSTLLLTFLLTCCAFHHFKGICHDIRSSILVWPPPIWPCCSVGRATVSDLFGRLCVKILQSNPVPWSLTRANIQIDVEKRGTTVYPLTDYSIDFQCHAANGSMAEWLGHWT